jgi:hypothetical protein
MKSPGAQENSKLDQRLISYAAAAAASGVGLLALATPAEAKVVYTATNIEIAKDSTVPLDLNGDGVPDFEVALQFSYEGLTEYLFVFAEAKTNEIRTGIDGVPAALPAGLPIGPNGKFAYVASQMARWSTSYGSATVLGPWVNVYNHYLGFRFSIDGKTHYGWARLSVKDTDKGLISATLTGYAYETIPNKAIISGDTGAAATDMTEPAIGTTGAPSLGLMAAGSLGLSIWRRE